MFNIRYGRSYRATFLFATVFLSASFMFFTWNIDYQGKPMAGRSHVSVIINDTIAKKGAFFEAAIRQVHQQLGDKMDILQEFDDTLMKQRQNHVTQMCSVLKRFEMADIMNRVSYYKNINVLYCSVPKVGTKFWFRMFHVMETGEHTSPFEISDGPKSVYRIRNSVNNAEIAKRIKLAQKIMFTRDPYKRIFSTYIDKLVSPNGRYWSIGRKILSIVRKSKLNTKFQCGQDVQFGELVKYLIATDPESYDRHFKPVSSQCDVCDIHYDVIGKVETFKHDVMYIRNITNASEKGVIFKDFAEEKNVDNIIFKVRRAFALKKLSLKCISDHMVHLRLWRVLQIGGLIDKFDNYPLNPDESQEANVTVITDLMLRAYGRSTHAARFNKQEALLQAYSQVPLEDLEQLRLKYLKDLILFDYEDRPSYLFDGKGSAKPKNKNSFDYYDAMSLSL
ncbi:carbohydrate sulfotransferase 11-like [Haliotis cracherodii]|uniref:carbohydrate sulfotransferase 11-like n=1 Tax=Haliotis cracherodii TaxID=6455 RepID=UPI0039E79980